MKNYNHNLFIVSLSAKALNGILEIFGSILLWFIDPEKTPILIRKIFQYELLEDPNDFVLNHLLSVVEKFSSDIRLFGFLYLLSHGLVKIILVIFLIKKKIWAYPLAGFIFLFFILYQTHLYINNHSVFLLVLNLIDVLIVFLIWREYKNLKVINKLDNI